MEYSTLNLEWHGHVVHVQLNRPDVMNGLNNELVDDLYNCFNELDENRDVRSIVLSGVGRAFCAGGDISFLQVINSQTHTGIRQLLKDMFYKVTILTRVEKPVIGALHGYVLGAGLSLSLLCDMRLAAENTIFGAEFPLMGLIPEMGVTHTLPALVGLGKAIELVITGRRFEADEAERLRIVNRVVPDKKLIDEAVSLAHHIAGLPPLAVGLSKAALHKGASSTLEESIQLEANINALCYQTEDHKEAASAFIGKRKPVFKGR